jgi:quinol monooxygenase YgiN
MVGNLRVVKIRSGEERHFEQLFAGLREELRRHEPGCLIYSLLRSRLHPGSYVIHEQYRDPAALAEHQRSPAVSGYVERIRELQDLVEVEYFDPISE